MERREIAAYLIIAAFGIAWAYYATQPNFGFGDETYYILAARAYIANNFIPATHIPNLYDTPLGGEPLAKPPLSYYIPALFLLIDDFLSANLFVYKMFPPLFAVLTLLLVYRFAEKISYEVALLSIVMVASVPLITHFTIITYFDVPYMFFYTLAVIKIYEALRGGDAKIAGVCLGLAFLCKESALFLVPALAVYLILKNDFSISKLLGSGELRTAAAICVIGLLMIAPWWARNYIVYGNPVYPFYPNVFGWKYLDELSYKVRMEIAAEPLTKVINYWRLEGYLGWFLFAGLFGVSYALVKKDYYFLSILSVGSLPIVLIGARDIRYIMFLLPTAAFVSSKYIYECLKSVRYGTLLFYLLTVAFAAYTANMMLHEGPRINDLRHFPPGTLKAYEWIKHNTPEDSVVLDLFTPNMVYVTGRKGVFPHTCCCGDLWEFWKLPEDEMMRVLRNHNISYIVTENYFYLIPKELRWLAGWTHIPEEFIYLTNVSNHFKLVYNTPEVFIFKVEY